MKNILKPMILGLLAATPAFSGGWEVSCLDTSMMYNDNGYAEVGTSSITYDINGTTQASAKYKMAKNQTRTSLGVKTQLGILILGYQLYVGSDPARWPGQCCSTKLHCRTESSKQFYFMFSGSQR